MHTLSFAFKREIIVDKTTCRFIGVGVFVLLTALGAFVRIPLPFTPVPVTLQTFFVLLSGICLGSYLGAVSQLSYIVLGMMGLPVFVGATSGAAYFLGPTGGYLIGFVIASLYAGMITRNLRNNLFLIISVLCVADFIILSCGTLWIKFLFAYPIKKAFFLGFVPFISADILKLLIAAVFYFKAGPRLREIF